VTRSRLLSALEEADGYVAEAARRLGVTRATVYNQMGKHGVDPGKFRTG
jgi:transcriptional regulator of acetoin/glycerol metabolism